MMDSLIKKKLTAVLYHSGGSLVIAIGLYVIVFGVWYPGDYVNMMPGVKLFLLVVAIELALGPLMSFVIYNPGKSRKELGLDYTIVILMQFAALIYGLLNVAHSRPVYVVFVKDRLDVVASSEIDSADQELARAEEYRRQPWFGPKFVCSQGPASKEEREHLLFVEYPQGKDLQNLPYFYLACSKNEFYNKAFDLAVLSRTAAMKELNKAIEKMNAQHVKLKWLPLQAHNKMWIALIKQGEERPVAYLDIDPYFFLSDKK